VRASQNHFTKFLEGNKQFIIPIYQRSYSWTLKECRKLWEDLLRLARDPEISSHFLGSIVYVEKGLYQISAVPQLLVIDGQQRLTTMSLLLRAVADAAQSQEGELKPSKIMNLFLVNPEEEHELRYRLLLTRGDKDALLDVIEGRDSSNNNSVRIAENYRFFRDALAKQSASLNDVYSAIQRLIIVDISLDRSHDNPQLIFESLNSTGVDLSQADLIRNYVLMDLEPDHQVHLYESFWHPMEREFRAPSPAGAFDRFMRDYLTIKTGRIPNISDVYTAFKDYAAQVADVDQLVADVYRYSRYFVRLMRAQGSSSAQSDAMKAVNDIRVEVAYPFLMEVLDDHEQGLVDAAEVTAILRTIESYIFRRAICGIPTNSLNKTFAQLGRELRKNEYLESFQAALLVKDSYKRFPTDEEFHREFVIKDVYNFPRRNYLFDRLENFDRKERVNVADYTIEHVLPQNPALSSAWQAMLGDAWKAIQVKYLHTMGNLTLTGYNPELSDRPFPEKQTMKGGFADSPVRLNRYLAQVQQWTPPEIEARADELANLAILIWPRPALSESVLAKYREETAAPQQLAHTLEELLAGIPEEIEALFQTVRRHILALDPDVREEAKKHYLAFKADTNFADVSPLKSKLQIWLNMAPDELHDPLHLGRDVSAVGHWGNGDIEIEISQLDQVQSVMDLVVQALDKQRDLVAV